MRPQQQNRRMRGRGNNNGRKGPNPLNRSYESNGPDVKIRGTAQQVADKYATLARDAQSSGDRVMAENYLQHAEHYYRIIAAAQAQNQVQQSQAQPARDNRDDFDDDFDEREDRDEQETRQQETRQQEASPRPSRRKVDDGSGPQPVIDGVPVEVALKEGQRNGTNGAKPNGHDTAKANGVVDEPKPAEASEGETAKETQPESAEEKPKPKRTRRPRVKKAAEPADSDDARNEEPAAAE